MTLPLKMEITTEGEPLVIKLSNTVLGKIGTAIAATVRANVRSQKQADGSAIKVNAQSTRRRKRRQGKPVASLIDEEHRLVAKGSYLVKVLRNTVEVSPKAKDISRWVQLKNYTGWLGISAKGRRLIEKILEQDTKRAIKKASSKRKKVVIG